MNTKKNRNENNVWIDSLVDEACGNRSPDQCLSDSSWERLVGAATAESGKHRMFTSFNVVQVLLQFAGGAVVGAVLMFFLRSDPNDSQPEFVRAQVRNDSAGFETVRELPRDKQFFYRVSNGNGFLFQVGTEASVLWRDSDPAALLLRSGTIYSHALSGENECPRLVTPHGTIDVTGSMSEVIVTPMSTEISVLDGNMLVASRGGNEGQVFAGGDCILLDGTGTHRYHRGSEITAGKRERVRAYLSAVAGTGEAVLQYDGEKQAG